ncbi:hypothetical protein PJP10_03335 [Mycobacterium kansasii]
MSICNHCPSPGAAPATHAAALAVARAEWIPGRCAGSIRWTHHQAPRALGKPTRRHPSRLPTPQHALRRAQSLGTPDDRSRLTTYGPGMSSESLIHRLRKGGIA